MQSKKLVIFAILLGLSGCAHHYTDNTSTDPYGFFSGVWHGLVSPFTTILNICVWLISFVDPKVFCNIEIVGRPNTGLFYYLGFVLGIVVYTKLAD